MESTASAPKKITLILPVYNVQDYLPRCLLSIDRQTFRDFRVIAINDGATDRSPEILRDFAEKHPYCTVVHQENQGLAAARNTGLSLADGEYIAFVDSDDFLAPTFLQELYDACEKNDADIACCFCYYYYEELKKRVVHPFRCHGVYDRQQAIKKLLQDLQVQSYAWNKLYKRTLFSDNHITYPTMAFEDLATTHRLFQHARRVAVIDRPLYYYVQRKTSILKTPNPKKINDFIRAAASVRISLAQSGDFPQYRRAYSDLCRKTNFYCDYYLLKYHLSRRSLKGLPTQLRKIHSHLHFYRSDRFHPERLTTQNLSVLPDALSVTE
ncbi:MAG: glycosyltransferase [Oscillospiraceae bacterium]|nr:glycosyltransferase [Oscillospiraceae bacterium]